MKNGLYTEFGELIYYKDDHPYHAGLVKDGDKIYYIGRDGRAVKGKHTVHSSMTNGILERGEYLFGEDCRLIRIDTDKNGLFRENDRLVYYRSGQPYHAGVVKDGEDIYYISDNGFAVKGKHDVHSEMSNGILKHGTYTFGDDYKLLPGTYVAPQKSKRKKPSRETKNKKGKAALRGIFLAASAVIVLVICTGLAMDKLRPDRDPVAPEPEEPQIVLPTFEEEVLLCSDAAGKAYNGEITIRQAIASGNPYKAFVFEYQLAGRDGTLSISEYPDMRDAREYILSAKERSVSIDNLKTGTAYYYNVTIGEETYPGSFKTAESTRFVDLPGVYNTRDIGGYTTLDGKKVRQGMLIRGTEIDGLVEPTYFLEKDALTTVQDTFGFTCDLDLRASSLFNGSYQTRLGKNVAHKFYDSPMYGSIFSADYQPALKQIFTDLADPQNYPMYLHCTYGADRTGTICFLIEGILGLPEEVMQRDYQLTGYFSSSYAASESFNSIYGGVEGYAGDTIQEKIVSYLTSPEVGVTMAQIESIRNIFLED